MSSLVIPPLYKIAHWRALLLVRLFVGVTSGCYNSREAKTSRNKRKRGMGSQKDIEQEEDMGSREVLSEIEGFYSRK